MIIIIKDAPDIQDVRYKQYINRGIALYVLIEDETFKSFQELNQEFDLTSKEHFKYFQLRDCFLF